MTFLQRIGERVGELRKMTKRERDATAAALQCADGVRAPTPHTNCIAAVELIEPHTDAST